MLIRHMLDPDMFIFFAHRWDELSRWDFLSLPESLSHSGRNLLSETWNLVLPRYNQGFQGLWRFFGIFGMLGFWEFWRFRGGGYPNVASLWWLTRWVIDLSGLVWSIVWFFASVVWISGSGLCFGLFFIDLSLSPCKSTNLFFFVNQWELPEL